MSSRVMLTSLLVVVLLGALLVGTGCSSSRQGADQQGPSRSDALREVGGMLILLSGEKGRGYANTAELAHYEHGHPLGYQAVKAGEIVVVPGATMPGEGDKGGTTAIVAYEKDVPTQGGHVLLNNGTVKRMTADEFRTAPKMGK